MKQVQVGTGAEKMGKIFAVWNSKKVQEELQRVNNSHWLWDGNKIAWLVFVLTLKSWTVILTCAGLVPTSRRCASWLTLTRRKVAHHVQVARLTLVTASSSRPSRFASPSLMRTSRSRYPSTTLFWRQSVSCFGLLLRHLKLTNLLDFLDHVIRATPSKHYHAQKRSFFAKGDVRRVSLNLDDCVMAQKGVYSSIRLCSVSPCLFMIQ